VSLNLRRWGNSTSCSCYRFFGYLWLLPNRPSELGSGRTETAPLEIRGNAVVMEVLSQPKCDFEAHARKSISNRASVKSPNSETDSPNGFRPYHPLPVNSYLIKRRTRPSSRRQIQVSDKSATRTVRGSIPHLQTAEKRPIPLRKGARHRLLWCRNTCRGKMQPSFFEVGAC
jgi:hypothetical protein